MRHVSHGRNVEIDRAKLLETLKTNRARHAEIYAEAMNGFRIKQAEVLASLAANAAACVERGKGTVTLKALHALKTPRNALKAYDEAIELFTWEQRDVIQLDTSEFRAYVLDRWDWTADFLMSNSAYSGTAAAMSPHQDDEDDDF